MTRLEQFLSHLFTVCHWQIVHRENIKFDRCSKIIINYLCWIIKCYKFVHSTTNNSRANSYIWYKVPLNIFLNTILTR